MLQTGHRYAVEQDFANRIYLKIELSSVKKVEQELVGGNVFSLIARPLDCFLSVVWQNK
jgi:hypothetical protein